MTIGVDAFHGQNKWNVCQELHAHFNLMAMTRLSTPSGHDLLSRNKVEGKEGQAINFNHAPALVAANMEELLPASRNLISQTVVRLTRSILRIRITERPNRTFRRESKQPRSKWTRVAGYSNLRKQTGKKRPFRQGKA